MFVRSLGGLSPANRKFLSVFFPANTFASMFHSETFFAERARSDLKSRARSAELTVSNVCNSCVWVRVQFSRVGIDLVNKEPSLNIVKLLAFCLLVSGCAFFGKRNTAAEKVPSCFSDGENQSTHCKAKRVLDDGRVATTRCIGALNQHANAALRGKCVEKICSEGSNTDCQIKGEIAVLGEYSDLAAARLFDADESAKSSEGRSLASVAPPADMSAMPGIAGGGGGASGSGASSRAGAVSNSSRKKGWTMASVGGKGKSRQAGGAGAGSAASTSGAAGAGSVAGTGGGASAATSTSGGDFADDESGATESAIAAAGKSGADGSERSGAGGSGGTGRGSERSGSGRSVASVSKNADAASDESMQIVLRPAKKPRAPAAAEPKKGFKKVCIASNESDAPANLRGKCATRRCAKGKCTYNGRREMFDWLASRSEI